MPVPTSIAASAERVRLRTPGARWVPRAAWAAGIALAAGLLFLAYLRQSQRVPVGSDAGSIALQAWDMRHGNLLLHGWAMSDVSFWSTELMQYVVLEALYGLRPNVIHIGGAMTYTLLILLAAYLARGRATGRDGAVRALVAAVIMLAPAPGASATLLITPDHLGSAVPVLLAWLAAERLPSRPAGGPGWARCYVPVVVALLLAWGQVADGLILLTGVAPMALACGARAWVAGRRRTGRGGTGRGGSRGGTARRAGAGASSGRVLGESPWPDIALAVAAIFAAVIARAAEAVIRLSGGYVLKPVATQFAGLPAMPHHVKLTAEGLLAIFGADFFSPHSRAGLAFAALHLTGVAAVAVAFVVALGRLGRGAEPAVPALALAIAFNVAAYLPTSYVQNLLSTREISAVLPFGAVLAGRILGAPVVAGPADCLHCPPPPWPAPSRSATTPLQPPVPAQNQNLAGWLAARHLTAGLSPDYWVANSTTLDTGGRITVRQVSLRHGTLARPLYLGVQA